MKQNKVIGIIFSVVNLILIAVCIFLYLRIDKKEPEFNVEAVDHIYIEGMDQSRLLEGISAYDQKDGDVTERIVIEKMMKDTQENTVVVFYAVSDRSGNVAKFSKIFPMAQAETQKEESGNDPGTAGYVEELEGMTALQTSLPTSTPVPTVVPTPTPTPTSTPTPTPVPTAEPTTEPQKEEKEPKASDEAPVLTLKMSEVKTAVGVSPAWVNVIQTLKDDKDSYETLFTNLKVSKYDVNQKGTYQVSVFTEDSDGNQSQVVPLTIIVQ